ncbi:MAG: glycosyltransferase family 2 protein, partial [Asgard group archaeon]|nr:glycosyltransferase family 2 protein [Asgard group archaeon]
MISIVIPVFNEEKNVVPLYTAINKIMQEISMPYEVIFVDDGSKDNTLRNLKRLQNNGITVGTLRIIELQKNYGQTFALLAGLHNTRGDKIITMDGDQQNDPKDIPRLLQELGKGYDVICGWRKERNDSIMKKVPSRINNFLNRKFNKIAIHDSGCTMRAYRKKALIDIELFAEDHRYLPAILAKKGNTIRELEVTHNHRKNGKSKYGINRLLRG